MNIAESANQAREKLASKLLAFNEAYIFVLEAEKLALTSLMEIKDKVDLGDIQETMHGSYLRLEKALKPHGLSTSVFYRSILFIDLISSIEIFFTELVRAVITEYPRKIGRLKFELKEILEIGITDELINRAADQFIHNLLFRKPEEYLREMCSTLSIGEEKLKQYWPVYIEAKSRRDLGVHYDWRCNETYMRKVSAMHTEIKAKVGDILIPTDREYCRNLTKNIFEMMNTMTALICNKYS